MCDSAILWVFTGLRLSVWSILFICKPLRERPTPLLRNWWNICDIMSLCLCNQCYLLTSMATCGFVVDNWFVFCLGPTPEMDLRHVNYIVSIIWRIPWRQCTSYCGLVLSHWSLGTWRPSAVRPCGRDGTVDQRGATHRLGPRFTIQFIWE